MFRNMGEKTKYKEIVSFDGHYRIKWDKRPIMIIDYAPAPDPLPEDYEPIPIGEHEDPIWCSFMEENFNYKPDINQIKNVILGNINDETDKKILNGFSWNGLQVYLSMENQFNYKTGYDLAVQTSGASLPLTFKFGDVDDPQYHTFETLEDITDFYTTCVGYVQGILQEGWIKKDSIDWEVYQREIDKQGINA